MSDLSNDFTPAAASEVTEEVVQYAAGLVDSFYPEGKIDWEDIWDRLDGTALEGGRTLWLPGDLMSPYFTQLKLEVRAHRKEA